MAIKIVNGVEVTLTPAEEAAFAGLRTLAQKYPFYKTSIQFDGISTPVIHLGAAKARFANAFEEALENAMNAIDLGIKVAQENLDSGTITALIAKRKLIRAAVVPVLDGAQNIDDLIALVPQGLKPYWPTS